MANNQVLEHSQDTAKELFQLLSNLARHQQECVNSSSKGRLSVMTTGKTDALTAH